MILTLRICRGIRISINAALKLLENMPSVFFPLPFRPLFIRLPFALLLRCLPLCGLCSPRFLFAVFLRFALLSVFGQVVVFFLSLVSLASSLSLSGTRSSSFSLSADCACALRFENPPFRKKRQNRPSKIIKNDCFYRRQKANFSLPVLFPLCFCCAICFSSGQLPFQLLEVNPPHDICHICTYRVLFDNWYLVCYLHMERPLSNH